MDPAGGNEKDTGRKTRKQTKEEFDVRIKIRNPENKPMGRQKTKSSIQHYPEKIKFIGWTGDQLANGEGRTTIHRFSTGSHCKKGWGVGIDNRQEGGRR